MKETQILKKAAWTAKNLRQVRDLLAEPYYFDTIGRNIIASSPLFDEAYYRRNTPELSDREDAALHYIRTGGFAHRDPSELFCSEEYLSLHLDVLRAGVNPLYHYEVFGRAGNYEVSTLQLRNDFSFPEGTESFEKEFGKGVDKYRRIAVVSCFFADGRIPETLLILVRGLKEVTDNIILVGDCPVFPVEAEKLDGLVCFAKFERHYQYDFGSYKTGLQYARQRGLLDPETTDELILLNDSCVGPVYPFQEVFLRMINEVCDFWGFTGDKKDGIFKEHISSYFLVFRKPILVTSYLDDFLNRIHGRYDRDKVIFLLETELTAWLEEKGFLWQMICGDHSLNIFFNPLTMLRDYRIPLVKKKSFDGYSREDLNEVMSIIRENATELVPFIQGKKPVRRTFKVPSIREHQDSLSGKMERIKLKAASGSPLKVLFLAAAYSDFSSVTLYEKMQQDPAYDVYIAFIPDLSSGMDQLMRQKIGIAEQERAYLSDGEREDRLIRIRPDELERWPDVCEGMDLVVYSTSRIISSFRYQPKYAAGRDFLPILVNADVPDAGYDARLLLLDAYRYCWKVFFISEEMLHLYQANGSDDGENGRHISDAKALIETLFT